MNNVYNNLTKVFFVENEQEKKVLSENNFMKTTEDNLIVSPEELKLKHFSDKEILRVKADNFYQALPEIIKQVNTDCLLYLKAAEKYDTKIEVNNLKLDTYNVQIDSVLGEGRINNLVDCELRLFNRNFSYRKVENFLKINISNYEKFYPELEKEKLNKYLSLYNEGDRKLETILYLVQRFSIEVEPEHLISGLSL